MLCCEIELLKGLSIDHRKGEETHWYTAPAVAAAAAYCAAVFCSLCVAPPVAAGLWFPLCSNTNSSSSMLCGLNSRYTNIALLREEVSVSEGDTFVVYSTADLANYEVVPADAAAAEITADAAAVLCLGCLSCCRRS